MPQYGLCGSSVKDMFLSYDSPLSLGLLLRHRTNGTTPDRESLNQQPHTSPEINTTERIINIINIIERMPVWRTRYLVSSQESTKAPLPHSQYLTTGKVLSSSVASPRTLGRL